MPRVTFLWAFFIFESKKIRLAVVQNKGFLIERLSNFLPTLPVWLVQKIRESCLFSVLVILIENKQKSFGL
jgi:hypothetical protein